MKIDFQLILQTSIYIKYCRYSIRKNDYDADVYLEIIFYNMIQKNCESHLLWMYFLLYEMELWWELFTTLKRDINNAFQFFGWEHLIKRRLYFDRMLKPLSININLIHF